MKIVDLLDFTLIIPTYNRHETLVRLLRFLKEYNSQLNIILLDSSDEEIKVRNKKTISTLLNSSLVINYFEFDKSYSAFDKFCFGASKVFTSFCAFCADDDLIFLDCVEDIIGFLKLHPDFVAGHGNYFNFYLSENACDVQDIVYFRNNLTQDYQMQRVFSLFSNYESTFYATYRTEALKNFFPLISQVNTVLWKELILAVSSVMSGKICRSSKFYYGRSTDESVHLADWHPYEIFSKEPVQYINDYLKCRKALFDYFGITQENKDSMKDFDLSHFFYLRNFLDPEMLKVFFSKEDASDKPKVELFKKIKLVQLKKLHQKYRERREIKNTIILKFLMSIRELLLSIGYRVVKHFKFLKPIIYKVGCFFFPSVSVKRIHHQNLSRKYNFRSEFFLRELPRRGKVTQKDMEFIIMNLERY